MHSILGKTGRDLVSGFIGVITGRTERLGGCDQLLLQPREKSGMFLDPVWFDAERIEVLDVAKVVVSPGCVFTSVAGGRHP